MAIVAQCAIVGADKRITRPRFVIKRDLSPHRLPVAIFATTTEQSAMSIFNRMAVHTILSPGTEIANTVAGFALNRVMGTGEREVS